MPDLLCPDTWAYLGTVILYGLLRVEFAFTLPKKSTESPPPGSDT